MDKKTLKIKAEADTVIQMTEAMFLETFHGTKAVLKHMEIKAMGYLTWTDNGKKVFAEMTGDFAKTQDQLKVMAVQWHTAMEHYAHA